MFCFALLTYFFLSQPMIYGRGPAPAGLRMVRKIAPRVAPARATGRPLILAPPPPLLIAPPRRAAAGGASGYPTRRQRTAATRLPPLARWGVAGAASPSPASAHWRRRLQRRWWLVATDPAPSCPDPVSARRGCATVKWVGARWTGGGVR
jgi:hypothetical protein